MANMRLGEALRKAGLIDDYQLQSALGQQRRWGGRIGKALIDLGFIGETTLIKFLSDQLKFSAVDLSRSRIAQKTFSSLPKRVAEKYLVIPIVIRETSPKKTLVLAMADPTDLKAIDEIEFLTRLKIEPVVALESAILNVLKRYGEEKEPEAVPMESITMEEASDRPLKISRDDNDQMSEMFSEAKPSSSGLVEREREFDMRADDAPSAESIEEPDEVSAEPIEEEPLEMVSSDHGHEEADVIEDVEPVDDSGELKTGDFAQAETPASGDDFFGGAKDEPAPLEATPVEDSGETPAIEAAPLGEDETVHEWTPGSSDEPEEAEAVADAEEISEAAPVAEEAGESTDDVPVSVDNESVFKTTGDVKTAVSDFWSQEPQAGEPVDDAVPVSAEAEPVEAAEVSDGADVAEAAEAVEEAAPAEAAEAVEAAEAEEAEEALEAAEPAMEAETEPVSEAVEAVEDADEAVEAAPEAVEEDAVPAVAEEAVAAIAAQPVASDELTKIKSELASIKRKLEGFFMLYILKEQKKISLEDFIDELKRL